MYVPTTNWDDGRWLHSSCSSPLFLCLFCFPALSLWRKRRRRKREGGNTKTKGGRREEGNPKLKVRKGAALHPNVVFFFSCFCNGLLASWSRNLSLFVASNFPSRRRNYYYWHYFIAIIILCRLRPQIIQIFPPTIVSRRRREELSTGWEIHPQSEIYRRGNVEVKKKWWWKRKEIILLNGYKFR